MSGLWGKETLTWRPLRSVVILAAALGAAAALGCGAGKSRPASPVSQNDKGEDDALQLPPIRLRAVEDGPHLSIEAYDAAGLFETAARNLRRGECDLAVDTYRRLVAEFPDSRFASPSLYNSGLCNEQLGRFDEAAGDYTLLVERYPESRDVTDALFRLAGAYEKLESWDEAVKALGKLLDSGDELEGIERIEALVRQGSSLIELDRLDEARMPLDEAVRLFRTGSGVSPSTSTFYYGMARFKLGEITQRRMRSVTLPRDEALLETELEKKCRLLLDAQNEYTQTIRIAHPHWAAAAAYRIGNLYRSLWDDMVAAPVPDDLSDEQKEIYSQVLKDRIAVLLKKAVVQWERTLKMARRLSLDNEWIDKTTMELLEIRQILAIDASSLPD